MDSSIGTLAKRLQKIQTELEIAERKKQEEATKAFRALSSISPEDIKMISAIAPQLEVITKYSLEDLKRNANGELAAIRDTKEALQTYLEARLKHYEDQL